MKISPARTAAYDVLLRIASENAFSSVLLPEFEADLAANDRALCHEIVLGVLRRQIYLDKLIDLLAKKPKFDAEVRIALRMGIFQMLFLSKVPSYAAINDSVNLVQRAKKSSAKGLVNAVLRNVQRSLPILTYSDEIDRISVETSHPKWLIERWIGEFGPAEAESLAIANNIAPKTTFRLTARSKKKGLEIPDSWTKSTLVDGCFSVERIQPSTLDLAKTGDIYFQDEASQMVGSSVRLAEGSMFLDVCAAPGGKTTQIASIFDGSKRMLAAGDRSGWRVRLLKENCERQEAEVSVVQYNAEIALPFAENTFDVLLIDAPCSGTGTIRNNPELRYFLKPSDIDELSAKQRRIIKNASKLVKPEGQIYYSTCSLEREENEEVMMEFLAGGGEFQKAVPNVVDRFITPEGFMRTFPQRDGLDGFFLAVLQRS